MKISAGATRTVFLTGRWAIKFPRFWQEGIGIHFSLFWFGMVANQKEYTISLIFDHPRLCPVLYAAPLGLMLVQPRCQPIAGIDALEIGFGQISSRALCPVEHLRFCEQVSPSIDNWVFNYGLLNGRKVCFDYGT